MVKLPGAIFKYVGPQRIDIIKNLWIRFTQPTRCNDPFEAQPSVENDEARIWKGLKKMQPAAIKHYLSVPLPGGKRATEEQVKEWLERELEKTMREFRANPEPIRRRMAERIREFWDPDLGLLSLSARENHLLMWSHYTEGHRGFVIEFDPQHEFFNPPRAGIEFGTLTRVHYSPKRSQQMLETPAPIRTFFVKSPRWSYEREWRAIRLLSESIARAPTAQGIAHLFRLPPESLKRVVLGCCMEQNLRKELVGHIRANPALSRIRIEQAQLDLDSFRLNYVPF